MKKVVDNFEQLSDMINFTKEDNMFVLLQIVARKKDNPEAKNESAKAVYYIRSKEHLWKLRDEIITLCRLYNARAYLNVSPKSIVQLQANVTLELTRKTIAREYDNPAHVTKSLAGKLISKDPVWMVDIDDPNDLASVTGWLLDMDATIYNTIPSFTGYHILTGKFDSHAFEIAFLEIHLHKNSMGALLYFEKEKPEPRIIRKNKF